MMSQISKTTTLKVVGVDIGGNGYVLYNEYKTLKTRIFTDLAPQPASAPKARLDLAPMTILLPTPDGDYTTGLGIVGTW